MTLEQITVQQAAAEYAAGNRCCTFQGAPVVRVERTPAREEMIRIWFQTARGPTGTAILPASSHLTLRPGAVPQLINGERPPLLTPAAFGLQEDTEAPPAPLTLTLTGSLSGCAELTRRLSLTLHQLRDTEPPYAPLPGAWSLQDITGTERGTLHKDRGRSTPERSAGVLTLRRGAWLVARLEEPEAAPLPFDASEAWSTEEEPTG